MAFNNSIVLSDLSLYIDQISYPKINTELVLASRVKEVGMEIIPGIKNGQTVNIAFSTLVGQAGDNCGLINPTGSFTITQATLQVCQIQFQESVCEDQIQLYYLGMSMPEGSYYDGDLTPPIFQEAYLSDKFNKIQDALEFIYFQGSSAGSTFSSTLPTQPNNYAQLAPLCNGFLEYLVNTSASMSVIPYTGVTTSNASGIVIPIGQNGPLTFQNAVYVVQQLILDMTNAAQNAVAQQDVIMMMSVVNYRTYVAALALANNGGGNFNYIGVENDTDWSIKVLGTNVTIYGMPGLVGTNFIILTPASNFVIGLDGASDSTSDKWQLWYEKLYDAHFFRAKMKLGVTVKYPEYVAIYNGDQVV